MAETPRNDGGVFREGGKSKEGVASSSKVPELLREMGKEELTKRGRPLVEGAFDWRYQLAMALGQAALTVLGARKEVPGADLERRIRSWHQYVSNQAKSAEEILGRREFPEVWASLMQSAPDSLSDLKGEGLKGEGDARGIERLLGALAADDPKVTRAMQRVLDEYVREPLERAGAAVLVAAAESADSWGELEALPLSVFATSVLSRLSELSQEAPERLRGALAGLGRALRARERDADGPGRLLLADFVAEVARHLRERVEVEARARVVRLLRDYLEEVQPHDGSWALSIAGLGTLLGSGREEDLLTASVYETEGTLAGLELASRDLTTTDRLGKLERLVRRALAAGGNNLAGSLAELRGRRRRADPGYDQQPALGEIRRLKVLSAAAAQAPIPEAKLEELGSPLLRESVAVATTPPEVKLEELRSRLAKETALEWISADEPGRAACRIVDELMRVTGTYDFPDTTIEATAVELVAASARIVIRRRERVCQAFYNAGVALARSEVEDPRRRDFIETLLYLLGAWWAVAFYPPAEMVEALTEGDALDALFNAAGTVLAEEEERRSIARDLAGLLTVLPPDVYEAQPEDRGRIKLLAHALDVRWGDERIDRDAFLDTVRRIGRKVLESLGTSNEGVVRSLFPGNPAELQDIERVGIAREILDVTSGLLAGLAGEARIRQAQQRVEELLIQVLDTIAEPRKRLAELLERWRESPPMVRAGFVTAEAWQRLVEASRRKCSSIAEVVEALAAGVS